MTTTAMAPTSRHKQKQFAFVLSASELQMLEDVARKEDMSKAHLVRFWIRLEYLKAFGNRRPGAEIEPTIRALVGDLSGANHYTVRNIADRAALPVHFVIAQFHRLQAHAPRVLECVDEQGEDSTWELRVTPAKALEMLEKAGFRLDDPLAPANPDADDDK